MSDQSDSQALPELSLNEYPRYPEGLNIYPENYKLYVPADMLHPLSQVEAEFAAQQGTTQSTSSVPKITLSPKHS